MCPFLLYLVAGDKDSIPITVIAGSKKANAPVNTDNRGYLTGIDILCLPCHRDMEKEFAVLMYKPGSAELPWFFKIVLHTFDIESCLYSSFQGIDREHAVLKKRIVPVPYEVILITVEYRSDPFLLIGQYGTVTGNDRTEYRFCHL